jgi:hypothetical protein
MKNKEDVDPSALFLFFVSNYTELSSHCIFGVLVIYEVAISFVLGQSPDISFQSFEMNQLSFTEPRRL